MVQHTTGVTHVTLKQPIVKTKALNREVEHKDKSQVRGIQSRTPSYEESECDDEPAENSEVSLDDNVRVDYNENYSS